LSWCDYSAEAEMRRHEGEGEMIDDDPNEGYEVVPIEAGPNGPPTGWWTVKQNGLPVRHFPGKAKAERYATDPEYQASLSQGKLGRRRRGNSSSARFVSLSPVNKRSLC
jgi:hypothetical protein